MFALQKKNRRFILAVCLLMLAVIGAGCGKEEEGMQIEAIGDGQTDAGNEAGDNTEAGDRDDTEENAGYKNAETGTEGGVAEKGEDAAGEDSAGAVVGEKNDSPQPDGEQESGQDSAAQSVGNTEITGNVRSLSADSFVICKSETWSEEGGGDYMVAVAPGYEEEEDLVTIQVSGNCTYSYKTVKNGGVSPEDVSTREGSFADLKEGILVTLKGAWQADGSFLADSVDMSVFV